MMQLKLHTITIEDMVPADHFVWKLDAALDLTFVGEETYKLYSKRYGRPAIDPVVLVKYLLLGYLYGIPSERQIEVQCRERMPFRWYLGLDIDSSVPDHSTISQNRRRRPSFRKLFRHLFEEVVGQCIAAVLMSGRLIATDSTYVKACASRSTEYLEDAPETPGAYWERLDQYQEDGLAILEQINQELLPIQAATADAAYHIPLVHRVLEEHGISFYVRPQKQGQSPIDKFQLNDFSYDKVQVRFRCPAGKFLRLNTLRRGESGLYWVYVAQKADCKSCPMRARCLSETDRRGARKVERNYFASSEERHFSRLDTPAYQEALRKRQIWCKGTFAAQKWGSNLTPVLRPGLEAAEDHCLLSATALNLKRMIRCLG